MSNGWNHRHGMPLKTSMHASYPHSITAVISCVCSPQLTPSINDFTVNVFIVSTLRFDPDGSPIFQRFSSQQPPLLFLFVFISTLFNQVGQLRTSSDLQLPPGQDKAKQCDKNNNTDLHINKRTVNNTIEKSM
jgi:hypothetical protein